MEQGISRRQSYMIQGIAILMMIYHHMYSFAETYTPVFSGLSLEGVRRIAWLCKLCVGLFAFVSGYGMLRVMDKKRGKTFPGSLVLEYGIVIEKLFKLYLKVWFVILLFKSIDFLWFDSPFEPKEFLDNMLGIEVSYNGALWYLLQYVKMMLILPLMDLFFHSFTDKKENRHRVVFYGGLIVLGAAASVVGLLWVAPIWTYLYALAKGIKISFTLIFVMGYVMARFGVVEWIGRKVKNLNAIVKGITGVVLMVIPCTIRFLITTDPAQAEIDFLLVPVFVVGALLLTEPMKYLPKVLEWLGKQSTYMWLCHVFLISLLAALVDGFWSGSLPEFLMVVLIAAAVSFLFNLLTGIISRPVRGSSQK